MNNNNKVILSPEEEQPQLGELNVDESNAIESQKILKNLICFLAMSKVSLSPVEDSTNKENGQAFNFGYAKESNRKRKKSGGFLASVKKPNSRMGKGRKKVSRGMKIPGGRRG